jgi:hypothetical protein
MRRIFAIAVAATLFAAPAALATPTPSKGTLSATKPKVSWTGLAYGTNLVGEPCNTDHSCDDFLLQVTTAGFVTVDFAGTPAAAGPAWLGGTIYQSDAKGTEGEQLADGGDLSDSSTVAADLAPGYYLVRISGLLTTLANYKATATLEP